MTIENIPENLNLIDSIKTLFSIYIDTLKHVSDISSDPISMTSCDVIDTKIQEILTEPNSSFGSMSQEVKDKQVSILHGVKTALLEEHINELITVFRDFDGNAYIREKFRILSEHVGFYYKPPSIQDFIKNGFNDEYINASMEFKESKGNKKNFYYIYDIIAKVGLELDITDSKFEVIEHMPYTYSIITSLYTEVVKEVIIPLAHPLGFNVNYFRLFYIELVDYYFSKITEPELNFLRFTCTNVSQPMIDLLDPASSATFGEFKEFKLEKDGYGRFRKMVDFYARNPFNPLIKQDGLRLVQYYDNTIKLFNRQLKENIATGYVLDNNIKYLNIIDARLVDQSAGLLVLIKEDSPYGVKVKKRIKELRYNGYSIINADKVSIEFLIDNSEYKWHTSIIDVRNLKVYKENINFLVPEIITIEKLLYKAVNYDGVLLSEHNNCRLSHEYKEDLNASAEENLLVTIEQSSMDYWARNETCSLPPEQFQITYGTRTNSDVDLNEISDISGEIYKIHEQPYSLGCGVVSPYPSIQNCVDGDYNDSILIGANPRINNAAYKIGLNTRYTDFYIKTDTGIPKNPNPKGCFLKLYLNWTEVGWNYNLDNDNNIVLGTVINGLGRNESHFSPSSSLDLLLINSTKSVADYDLDNIGNENYSAKESFDMWVQIFDIVSGSYKPGVIEYYIETLIEKNRYVPGEIDAITQELKPIDASLKYISTGMISGALKYVIINGGVSIEAELFNGVFIEKI